MGQYNIVIEQRSRRRWAAIGFVLIVALSVIAWFAAPTVLDWLKTTFKPLGSALVSIPKIQQQIALTVIVFFLLSIVTALVVTLGAPRQPLEVREKDLVKEREDNVKYRRRQRKLQRKFNREMREYVEKNQK